MRIAFINGSPKIKESASQSIVEDLKKLLLTDSNIISEFCFRKPQLDTEDAAKLLENDVLVFAFPLYVDGIPSHLLNCLVQLEGYFSKHKEKDIRVYTLVNCGFHEGEQNALAIEIMENWCKKAGLKWGQGIGIGAGGMLAGLKNVPIGKGPKKNLGKALNQLSNNILNRASEDNLFITANFPRFLYKLGAEIGWGQAIKANGLSRKDLFLRK